MTRKTTMSAQSRAIVDYLRKHGATTRAALNAAFPGEAPMDITWRLNNLSLGGWVQFDKAARTWEIRPSARGLFPALRATSAQRAQAPAPAPAPAPAEHAKSVELVPPARYDRMQAPVWTQSLAPAARPGASDFQCVPSRGLRC